MKRLKKLRLLGSATTSKKDCQERDSPSCHQLKQMICSREQHAVRSIPQTECGMKLSWNENLPRKKQSSLPRMISEALRFDIAFDTKVSVKSRLYLLTTSDWIESNRPKTHVKSYKAHIKEPDWLVKASQTLQDSPCNSLSSNFLSIFVYRKRTLTRWENKRGRKWKPLSILIKLRCKKSGQKSSKTSGWTFRRKETGKVKVISHSVRVNNPSLSHLKLLMEELAS